MIWLYVPREIFGIILQSLTLHEISTLDKAILNRCQRKEYLSYLQGIDLSLQMAEEYCFSDLVTWLLTRKVSTKIIHLYEFNPTGMNLVTMLRCSLVTLAVGSCKNIQDSDLDSFPDCPSLTSLSLSAWRLSDSSLRRVLVKYPHLKSLDISHSYLLTDETIISLAAALPGLTHLDLSYSKWFTDESIKILLSAQFPLVSLILSGTSVFHDQSIQDILVATSRQVLHLLSLSADQYSYECRAAVLKEIALPSLMSDVPSRQLLGLQGYFDFFHVIGEGFPDSLVEEALSSGDVVVRLIQFLRAPHSPRHLSYALFLLRKISGSHPSFLFEAGVFTPLLSLLKARRKEFIRDGFQLIAALARVREDFHPQIISCGLLPFLTLAAQKNFQMLLINARCCLPLLPDAPVGEVTDLFSTLLSHGDQRRVYSFFLDAISRLATSPTVLCAFVEVDLVGVLLGSLSSDPHSFHRHHAFVLLFLLLVDHPVTFPTDLRVLCTLRTVLLATRLDDRSLQCLSSILINSDPHLLRESGLVPVLLSQLGDPLSVVQEKNPELLEYLFAHRLLVPCHPPSPPTADSGLGNGEVEIDIARSLARRYFA